MENKRMTKKLNSWFWFVLTILPIIFLFISCIIVIVHYRQFDLNSGLGFEYINQVLGDFDFWHNALSKFDDFTINSLYDMFYSLFDILGVRDNYDLLSIIFGYMLSIQVYHLIYDCLTFIFDWLHDFFERG